MALKPSAITVLLAFTLVASACGTEASDDITRTTAQVTPELTETPVTVQPDPSESGPGESELGDRLSTGDCPDSIGGNIADAACVNFVVPIDRTAPFDAANADANATIFAVVVSPAVAPTGDGAIPILDLGGAAGTTTTNLDGRWSEASRDALFTGRAVIHLDHRGTGGSTPSLVCPGRKGAVEQALATTDGAADESARIAAAAAACAADYDEQSIDRSAFGHEAMTADATELMTALGYDTWHLYGSSDGARLATTIAQTTPDRIASVIADSPSPDAAPDGEALRSIVDPALLAATELFRYCDRHPICRPTHNGLLNDTAAWLVAGETVTVPATGDHVELTLTGADTNHLMIAGLADATDFFQVAALGVDPRTLAPAVLAEAAAAQVAEFRSVADGVALTVACESLYAGVTADDVADAIASNDRIATTLSLSNAASCEAWDLPEAADTAAETSADEQSAVPYLIATGRFDPTSTDRWIGRAVGASFSDRMELRAEALAHAPIASDGCAAAAAALWLDDSTLLADGCLAELAPPPYGGEPQAP